MILLCAAVFLLMVTPAAAAENRGSVRVRLDTGELPVIHGAVNLYQVGIRTEEGYRITEAFGGGIVRQEDKNSDKLAQWLAESAEAAGIQMLLDADGRALFPELEEGLYMLAQTERTDGFYPIYPVLLTIPDGENWNVTINRQPVPVVTELPKTGQSLLPFLGIMGKVFSSLGLLLCIVKSKKQ